jgi:hypothetical protein
VLTTTLGVLLLAGGSMDNISATLAQIQAALGGAAAEVYPLDCAARPEPGGA